MIIGGYCLKVWDGREQCPPGGGISLIRGQDGIAGASWLVRRLYDNIGIPGGSLIDVGGYECSQEEISRKGSRRASGRQLVGAMVLRQECNPGRSFD